MKCELTLAKHDPSHCLAPGLFRNVPRGKRPSLDVRYRHGEDELRFWGPAQLGSDDLRMLQGLVALAAISGETRSGTSLSEPAKTEEGRALLRGMSFEGGENNEPCAVVIGTYLRLAKELGYASCGGAQIHNMQRCIERLYSVTIFVTSNGIKRGYRLLSHYSTDKRNHLMVALNPRIAKAVFSSAGYVWISMDEVRRLKSEAAAFIHQRLCGWINLGDSRQVELDTICGYVWLDSDGKQPSFEALKKRRSTARKALAELQGLGWSISQKDGRIYEVGRPTGRRTSGS